MKCENVLCVKTAGKMRVINIVSRAGYSKTVLQSFLGIDIYSSVKIRVAGCIFKEAGLHNQSLPILPLWLSRIITFNV